MNNLYRQCDIYLNGIKSKAWDVNFEPDVWTQMESFTNNMYNWLDSVDNPAVNEYVLNKITHDMLLSFLICLQGSTHPIAYRSLTMLETIDKKWTDPYDEEMAENLIDGSRLEVNGILNGFSFLNVSQYFIGLIKYGYFDKFPLEPNFDDTRWYRDDMKRFLISGSYMDSDEHISQLEFMPGSFAQLWSSPDKAVESILNAGLSYMRQTIQQISGSQYNHNELEHRLYAREKFSRELIETIGTALVRGDVNGATIDWLSQHVVVKNDPAAIVTQEQLRAALSPLADMVLRCILEGHIMSGVRMAKIKTFSMVIDTIIMRRMLENERRNIKYQESIGRQDDSYAASLFNNKGKSKYIGQGLWRQS